MISSCVIKPFSAAFDDQIMLAFGFALYHEQDLTPAPLTVSRFPLKEEISAVEEYDIDVKQPLSLFR